MRPGHKKRGKTKETTDLLSRINLEGAKETKQNKNHQMVSSFYVGTVTPCQLSWRVAPCATKLKANRKGTNPQKYSRIRHQQATSKGVLVTKKRKEERNNRLTKQIWKGAILRPKQNSPNGVELLRRRNCWRNPKNSKWNITCSGCLLSVNPHLSEITDGT